MIAPLVALKRRARTRYHRRSLPRLENRKIPIRKRSDIQPGPKTVAHSTVAPPIPTTEGTTVASPNMGFAGEIEMDDVMSDDEFNNNNYNNSNNNNAGFVLGEVEDKDNQGGTVLRPKLPFKDRVNPFVGPKDPAFLAVENYFSSLLRTPGLSVDDILEGTFDSHEITFITPQPGPPDLVDWQRRNARRYFENLETRFRGRPDTPAFKMACVYFGFPVEPLRMGALPFPLSPDPLDAEKAALDDDPLKFLNKYAYADKSVYDENALNLRGGGTSDYVIVKKEEEDDEYWPPPKEEKKTRRKSDGSSHKAIQEVSPDGYKMDIGWDGLEVEEKALNERPAVSDKIRLYGWQGAMNAFLAYPDFVSQVDRLISNWERVDRSVCVEIWSTSPTKFEGSVTGMIYHDDKAPAEDPVWRFVTTYFESETGDDYACFVSRGGEDDIPDGKDRPGGYQPLSNDQHVVRIENEDRHEVAYMRVPGRPHAGHGPHQYSREYMLAMQVLQFPQAPHALVSYQKGLAGEAYQCLDPPSKLWDEVTDSKSLWSSHPTIPFKLRAIDGVVVPVVIPGVFTSEQLPRLRRADFEPTGDGDGLEKIYKTLELSLKGVDLENQCDALEIWCPGPNFKYVTEPPTRVEFSGSATSSQLRQRWLGFLDAITVPDTPFCLVVRPVYKDYRLRKLGDDDDEKIVNFVSLQMNQCDLKKFRAFVRNRLRGGRHSGNSPEVILLGPASQRSFQPKLTIQKDTTEDEWERIGRYIIEPELAVEIGKPENEWHIPEKALWGPRYVAKFDSALNSKIVDNSASETKRIAIGTEDARPTNRPSRRLGLGLDGHMEKGIAGADREAIDFLFRESRNTSDEAARVAALRARSFTGVDSIFTNPLKPVMPAQGPPLESVLRAGPSMPGVSIAMMTPTEMLRLQREVHSLRRQLLDRTRECPYAGCDRHFTFADADGLDRHVREDHSVLRCFLCTRDEHLLPYYDVEQIKKHFIAEHVDDVLKAFGTARVKHESDSAAVVIKDHSSSDRKVKAETVPSPILNKARPGAPAKQPDDLGTPHGTPAPGEEEDDDDELIIQFAENPWERAAAQTRSNKDPWEEAAARKSAGKSSQTSVKPEGDQPGGPGTQRRGPAKVTTTKPKMKPSKDDNNNDDATAYYNSDGDSSSDSGSGGGTGTGGGGTAKEKNKRKRKRPGDIDTSYQRLNAGGSGDEAYEYSERSAVTDPLANLRPDAPPSPKRYRTGGGGGSGGPKSARKAKTPATARAPASAPAPAASSFPPAPDAPPLPLPLPLPTPAVVTAPAPAPAPATTPTPQSQPQIKTEATTTTAATTTAAPTKKKRAVNSPATVTRRGRTVRASRAAREAAAAATAKGASTSTAEDKKAVAAEAAVAEEDKGESKGRGKGRGRSKTVKSEDGELETQTKGRRLRNRKAAP